MATTVGWKVDNEILSIVEGRPWREPRLQPTQAPTLKLGGGQGPRGTLANVVVGHLHDPHRQGLETLLHCRPTGAIAWMAMTAAWLRASKRWLFFTDNWAATRVLSLASQRRRITFAVCQARLSLARHNSDALAYALNAWHRIAWSERARSCRIWLTSEPRLGLSGCSLRRGSFALRRDKRRLHGIKAKLQEVHLLTLLPEGGSGH
jgi:hypothetical protein